MPALVIPGQDKRHFSLEELNDEPRVPYTGKMKYLHSVSELKMVPPSKKGCPRKWLLMYLAKTPKIPNEALIDGIIVHKCGKDWADARERDAALIEWSRKWQSDALSPTHKPLRRYAQLFLAMARHVPEAEKKRGIAEATYFLELPELNTAIYIKPDWLALKRFRDWKTTAATTRTSPWVLQQPEWWMQGTMPADRQTITNDIQSRTYAHGLMKLFEWDRIDAGWVYGSKKFKPSSSVKTWVCEAAFERDETRAWVERYIYPMIVWMNAVKDAWVEKRIASPLHMPHASSACEAVGKFCDAYGACRLQPSHIPLSVVNLPVFQP